jgi:hypothetical protein
MLRACRVLLCLVLVSVLGACAQTVTLKTAEPGARVFLDGEDLGEVQADGVEVKVDRGLAGVPWEVREGEGEGAVVRSGVIERTEVNPWLIAGGVAATICCVPSAVVAGACVANPAILVGAVGCLLTQGSSLSCCTALSAPSWFTIPVAAGGAAAGLSPLALGLLAEEVPKEVLLETTGDEAEAPPAAPETAEVIPW